MNRLMLTFSSRNLSEDCARVVPGGEVLGVPMDSATALQRLSAFAGLSAMELSDDDARIYLANTDMRLAVQNEGGRLYSRRVPEGDQAAVEQTPEEIIASLAGESAPASGEDMGTVLAEARNWRDRLNTPWSAVALLVVAAILAYHTFSPDVPAGISLISAPSRIASLDTQFSGRYGEAAIGATVLSLQNGRIIVQQNRAQGAPGEPLMDSSYRYGLRGEEVVLVVANGAVLELAQDGSLRFNDTVYPRAVAP
jgi:hypothetical protein